MKLYPLFADLSHRAVLVVGGGAVAERKVAALLGAQAQVTVNAPALTPQLRRWVSEGRIAHRADAFQEGWLERLWLVVAATSDRETNALVATLAGLKAERYVADKDAKLALYGLDKPRRVIVLRLKAGETRILHIGNSVGGPTGKQVYAKVEDKDRSDVFVLSEADSAKVLAERKFFSE